MSDSEYMVTDSNEFNTCSFETINIKNNKNDYYYFKECNIQALNIGIKVENVKFSNCVIKELTVLDFARVLKDRGSVKDNEKMKGSVNDNKEVNEKKELSPEEKEIPELIDSFFSPSNLKNMTFVAQT